MSVGNHVVLAACLSPIDGIGFCEAPPQSALTDALYYCITPLYAVYFVQLLLEQPMQTIPRSFFRPFP